MRCRQREGTEEGNDRGELYPQRRIEGGKIEFRTTWGDAGGSFCDKFCVKSGYFGGSSLNYTGLVAQM